MENIIKQVIESEYRAQKIIDEVQAERVQTEERMADQLLKIKESMLLSTRQKIEEYRLEKLEQASLQADKTTAEANKKALIMKQKMEENRELWSKQLLSRVLERNI